jgi:hypothetical protein
MHILHQCRLPALIHLRLNIYLGPGSEEDHENGHEWTLCTPALDACLDVSTDTFRNPDRHPFLSSVQLTITDYWDNLVFGGVHEQLWACAFISTCDALGILQLRLYYPDSRDTVVYDLDDDDDDDDGNDEEDEEKDEPEWIGTIAEWMDFEKEKLSGDYVRGI